MTRTATRQSSPRPSAPDELAACIGAACGHRQDATLDLGRVLMRYWVELPARSPADRAALLEQVTRRIRAGELSRQALVPFALGDSAHAIVAMAVTHYVGCGPLSIERRRRVVHEAVEWIRRGLALNCAAVFTALLATGDEEILARLCALRLLLGAAEVSLVHAQFVDEQRPVISTFLADWRDLMAKEAALVA